MPNWKEPHWGEGMLLLPQHLQLSHRYLTALIGAAWDSTPYSWGVRSITFSEASVRSGNFAIERCRVRTADGTWFLLPENADVAPRPLNEALDASPDGVIVYLAIPRLHEIRPNASYEERDSGPPTRFLIEPLELRDENRGDNPQQVEVHSLRGRLLFGDERNLPGYESVPIARVYRSAEEGGAPRLDEKFIAPLMAVEASDALMRMLKEVLNDVLARNQELAAEAAAQQMSFRSGMQEHIERLLMLHVLNEAAAWLRHVLSVPAEKPCRVYGDLCRLGGQLAVFSGERRVMEYPRYDHLNLGHVFALVCDHVRALLKPFAPGSLAWRDFVPREGGKGLEVALEENWLGDDSQFYIGVHTSALDENETDQLLRSIDWKIAASADVDTRFAGGLNGLQLRPVRGSTGLLPASPEIKYYQVYRDEELWPRVRDSQTLAIRYSPAGQARLEGVTFRVYVVMGK